ncbi:MAG TPA: PQQ-binding-like beta-propeller repeat protein [Gemmataceae bacterium]|nr:PQQ-binding-like beta-propeller repeat protein [Gemmataceae bacterium]
MKTRCFLLVAVGLGLIPVAAVATDWPQWRGPERNGTSKETGLLAEWPKDGPKLIWQVNDLGTGYGAVSMAGGRVYLISNKGLEEEFALALDIKDGKQVWTAPLGKVGNPGQRPSYPAARSTPTVDGDLVYALSSDGDLACLEAATGKAQWQKSIRKEFGGQPGTWAYSESPLIDGDVLVCTPGGKDATLVALNKKTGELIWKSPVPGGDLAAYASVIAVEAGGVKQYVQFVGKGVIGVDAKTGKFLWRFDETGKGPANMPTPVAHEGYVYTSAGRAGSGGLVKVAADGDKVTAEKVYLERDLPTSIGGSVLVGGNLYGTGTAGLVCAEFTTGKVKWREKSVGSGSVLFADGKLFIHGENGQVILVEANPEKFVEKGRFTPPGRPKQLNKGEQAWAYPALADGRLYVREHGTLWCYDVKGEK